MIQRIQSLFYLLAAGGFGSLFYFPFATSDKPVPEYMTDQVYNIMDHIVLIIMAGLGTLITLGAIFLFKNRKVQLRLGNLAVTLAILLPFVAFLLLYVEKTSLDTDIGIHDKAGMYIPIAILLCSVLANRFVKKDDNLVKSMDRLR